MRLIFPHKVGKVHEPADLAGGSVLADLGTSTDTLSSKVYLSLIWVDRISFALVFLTVSLHKSEFFRWITSHRSSLALLPVW
jgi:hypothetical protein